MQRVNFSKYAVPLVNGKEATNKITYLYSHNSLRRNYSETHHTLLTRSQLKRYCDILGVPINASEAKIKQSFYKKSFLVHPDKNKSSVSGQKFNEISEAYQALLRHARLGGHEHHTPIAITKDGSKHVRPWFQSHRKPPSSHRRYASEVKDAEAASHHFSDKSDSSFNTEHHSQAGGWCHQNYREQLKEDYVKRKLMRKQSQDKVNSDNSYCVLM